MMTAGMLQSMRLTAVLGIGSLLLLACEPARADPCAGQPPDCREAVEAALERLGPDGRSVVTNTQVQIETDCALIDPEGDRGCPTAVTYAARVTFELREGQRFPLVEVVVARFGADRVEATWDSRQAPGP